MVDLAGEITLQAADDLMFEEAFFGAPSNVGDGVCVPMHANDYYTVEHGVSLTVSTSVESVAATGFTGPGRDRAGATKFRKRGFGADAVGKRSAQRPDYPQKTPDIRCLARCEPLHQRLCLSLACLKPQSSPCFPLGQDPRRSPHAQRTSTDDTSFVFSYGYSILISVALNI